MSNISRWRTEEGITFFYDNETNQLHEENGALIQLRNNEDHSYYLRYVEENYNTQRKGNAPVALRILMGHACNYSCSYCMQKELGVSDELPKRRGLDDFIGNTLLALDLSRLERIELWGGEPFLYWNDMVALMTALDAESRTFAITTNGSALRVKHADFFRTLKATVLISISHDALHQGQLRGEDIFTKPKVIEAMQALGEVPNLAFGFICSVTHTNFDLFEINNFFHGKISKHNLKTCNLAFSLGRSFQEGEVVDRCGSLVGLKESLSYVPHGENLEKLRLILSDFLEAHYQQFIDGGMVNGEPALFSKDYREVSLLMTDIYEFQMALSVTECARKVIVGEPVKEGTNCGADMADVLAFDLDGNVRTCPHSSERHIAGRLNDLSGVKVHGINLDRQGKGCRSCINRKLCKRGCPIKLPDEVFYANCAVEKVWYGEIQKAAFRFIFGHKVELIEAGLDSISIFDLIE